VSWLRASHLNWALYFKGGFMSKWQESYQKEAENIAAERAAYQNSSQRIGAKIFDKLSLLFLLSGFVSLGLVAFTEVTLVQSTCFFVISFVLSPTDGDRLETMLKGMAEDLANIRINTAIESKSKSEQ
jgi:fatty-acid desaturase